jgi:hypothetical protein
LAPTPAHPSARSNAPGAAEETLELETLDDDIELETDELGVTLEDTELETVTDDTAALDEEDEDDFPFILTLPPPQAVMNPVINNVAKK